MSPWAVGAGAAVWEWLRPRSWTLDVTPASGDRPVDDRREYRIDRRGGHTLVSTAGRLFLAGPSAKPVNCSSTSASISSAALVAEFGNAP